MRAQAFWHPADDPQVKHMRPTNELLTLGAWLGTRH
jgi:hypothetical protein